MSISRLVPLAYLALTGCAVLTPTKDIVAPSAKWEEVSRAGRAFGEGIVAAKDGRLYASDITPTSAIKENNPGGTIWRYDPASGRTEKFMEPSAMSNGLHVDRNGDLIIAQGADTGGRAVVRRNLASGALSVVAASHQGRRFNSPNDVTSDAQGRLYFTDSRFFGTEPMELPNTVYRVDAGGKITELKTGMERPNGIEVSPDGRTLYISTTNLARFARNPHGPEKDAFGILGGGVVAFDLDASGEVANGRVVFQRHGNLDRRDDHGHRRQPLHRDA
jgi:gluconolactonase